MDFIKKFRLFQRNIFRDIYSSASYFDICLLNGHRELYLKMDSMYIEGHRSIFHIAKSLKSKRPGFLWHHLEFVVYPTYKNSCADWLIILYLGKTSAFKEKHNSSLLISYIDPKKSVSPKTIAARYLMEIYFHKNEISQIFQVLVNFAKINSRENY